MSLFSNFILTGVGGNNIMGYTGITRSELDAIIAAKHFNIRYRRPELGLVKVQKRFDLINRTDMVKTSLNVTKIQVGLKKCIKKYINLFQ